MKKLDLGLMANSQSTFASVEKAAAELLAAHKLPSAQRDARLLFQSASGMDRAEMLTKGEHICPIATQQRLQDYLARRCAREPVYRILGQREFHGLVLQLSPETLEPRDDTETLIDACLAQIADTNANLSFLDLGTGTGAIALALLTELPNATSTVTDISPEALLMATKNADSLELAGRFTALHSNWFDQVLGKFDFIVSNPPYIASTIVDNLEPEVLKHDPRLALDGGVDGLDAYREIFASAKDHLTPSGFLALEIGYDQKEAGTLLGETIGLSLISAMRDYGGQDRALVFKQTGDKLSTA